MYKSCRTIHKILLVIKAEKESLFTITMSITDLSLLDHIQDVY